MQVRELMTRRVHTCRPDTTARHALALMWKHDVGVLPIVGANRDVLGMITDRDIAMAVGLRNVAPGALTVGEISTNEVWVVAPTTSIRDAERVMQEHQVRRLPVIEEGRLVGIVALADLVRAGGADRGEVADALAAITSPREPEPV